MKQEGEFFVIELTNKDKSRVFVVEKPNGIHVSDQPIADMKQFSSYGEATTFIKKHHLERNGAKASIISNQKLIQIRSDYKTMITAPMVYYTVINGAEEKIFFDSAQDGYYFKQGEVGYCVWQDEDSVKLFIQQMEFPSDVTFKRLVQGITTDQKN